jgi:ribosome-binding factor A
MAHSSGSRHPYPRTARLNQVLREIISEQLMRISDVDERIGLLTVTGVDTSADMSQAMVFFDSLSEEASEVLEQRRAQIQAAVNSQTRMKRTPKLSFMADPAIAHGAAVEEILRRHSHDDE